MSRPTITIGPSSAALRCMGASASLTPLTADTCETLRSTSTVCRPSVASSPSTKHATLSRDADIQRSESSPTELHRLSISTPRRRAVDVAARYVNPVSRNRNPSRAATRAPTVVFPDAPGPSMATASITNVPSDPKESVSTDARVPEWPPTPRCPGSPASWPDRSDPASAPARCGRSRSAARSSTAVH